MATGKEKTISLNKTQLSTLLRIWDPFLMIDKVTNIIPSFSGRGSKHINKDEWFYKCHFGTFAEMHIGKIDRLKKIISKRFQTITYYGLERKKLNDFILRNGITGVDRIVPVGRAFDIGPIWDGYDIIYSLSRIISK